MGPFRQAIFLFAATLFIPVTCGQGKNLKTIKINAGDRIWCHSNPLNPIYHFLLAASDDTFIHVVGSQSTHEATIKHQSRRQWMDTGYAEEYCSNKGPGPLGATASVAEASKFVGLVTYYDLLRCNCQHYLNYWTSGSSGISYNSRMRTNDKCLI